jgi:hypothetical protein
MTLPMEKATYRAKAVNSSFGVTPEKGTNFVAIGFEVVDHEQLAGERTDAWMGYFAGKATERTIESLQLMGFASDDLSLLEECNEQQCADLLPNVVEIVCEPEEFDGNWRLRVQWVNRPGSGRFVAKQPLKGTDLKAFAAQMKGALRNARGGAANGSKPATKPAHPNALGGGKDDVPF